MQPECIYIRHTLHIICIVYTLPDSFPTVIRVCVCILVVQYNVKICEDIGNFFFGNVTFNFYSVQFGFMLNFFCKTRASEDLPSVRLL